MGFRLDHQEKKFLSALGKGIAKWRGRGIRLSSYSWIRRLARKKRLLIISRRSSWFVTHARGGILLHPCYVSFREIQSRAAWIKRAPDWLCHVTSHRGTKKKNGTETQQTLTFSAACCYTYKQHFGYKIRIKIEFCWNLKNSQCGMPTISALDSTVLSPICSSAAAVPMAKLELLH